MSDPTTSIVVPVLNEAPIVEAALARLRRDFPDCELVVVDGGSDDDTARLAARQARLIGAARGRARQMNAGAACTSGEVLWFVHADTAIEPAALDQLRAALAGPGVVAGGLRIRFDRPGIGLRYLAWASNLRARRLGWIFGDQAMFVRRSTFEAMGGFPDLPLMEDLEMSRRLARAGRVVLLDAESVASARRIAAHGTWRMVALMQWLKLLHFAGVDPAYIARRYSAGPRRRNAHRAARRVTTKESMRVVRR